MEYGMKKLFLILGLVCATGTVSAMQKPKPETKKPAQDSPPLGFSINAVKSPDCLFLEACDTGELATVQGLLQSGLVSKLEVEVALEHSSNLELNALLTKHSFLHFTHSVDDIKKMEQWFSNNLHEREPLKSGFIWMNLIPKRFEFAAERGQADIVAYYLAPKYANIITYKTITNTLGIIRGRNKRMPDQKLEAIIKMLDAQAKARAEIARKAEQEKIEALKKHQQKLRARMDVLVKKICDVDSDDLLYPDDCCFPGDEESVETVKTAHTQLSTILDALKEVEGEILIAEELARLEIS